MKICQSHWAMMRAAIAERGMEGLIATTGEEAHQNMVDELSGAQAPFDPLMSMNWHFSSEALRNGGLYLMSPDEDGNPYCPICEFEKHMKGFIAADEINSIADQMLAHCREERLLPKSQ